MESSEVRKISSRIISQRVIKEDQVAQPQLSPEEVEEPIIHMNEELSRPEGDQGLDGMTYKIRDPNSGHALYVTINNMVLNRGTDHEIKRPFEIFINSKNMDHFQWVVALTRVLSAVFRKGGDCTFLVEEMKAVFDPKGGYWKPGGVYCPSLIADIGHVLESHFKTIGLIKTKPKAVTKITDAPKSPGAQCPDCKEMTLHFQEGCHTCTNCGFSKCGG